MKRLGMNNLNIISSISILFILALTKQVKTSTSSIEMPSNYNQRCSVEINDRTGLEEFYFFPDATSILNSSFYFI